MYVLYIFFFIALRIKILKICYSVDKIYENVITTLSPPSYYKNSPHNLETISQYISLYLYKHIWNIVPYGIINTQQIIYCFDLLYLYVLESIIICLCV